jgi:predicted ATPase
VTKGNEKRMGNFTLHVEDFGKIDSATVELAPLTLFVGDNNSGKSYLMSLIYGMFATEFVPFEALPPDISYIGNLMKDVVSDNSIEEYTFSAEDYTRFERIINESIENHKSAFVAQIFNKEIPTGKIQFRLHPTNAFSLSVYKKTSRKKNRLIEETCLELSKENDGQLQGLLAWNMNKESDIDYLAYILVAYLFGTGQYIPIFLPASRTGFMLTYRSLIKHSIEKSFVREADKPIAGSTVLTKPCIDFLTHINGFSYEQQKQAYRKDITDFIETNILHGKLSVNKLPTPDITYTPNGLDEGIPLHVSSGVVTETAPLVLALADPKIDFLQIEEPEMCLHPKLQKEMARALIRIVNSGMPVLASTHSDIILQHVNNILRLKNHPDREKIMKELGYDEEDMIDPKDVKVYQFDSNKTRSSVKEIEFDPEDGFAAPTFTDSLSELLNETMQILREDQ